MIDGEKKILITRILLDPHQEVLIANHGIKGKRVHSITFAKLVRIASVKEPISLYEFQHTPLLNHFMDKVGTEAVTQMAIVVDRQDQYIRLLAYFE